MAALEFDRDVATLDPALGEAAAGTQATAAGRALLARPPRRRALEVDLIDVRRLERILVRALDQESIPDTPELPPPPGRFARSGSVFAQSRTQTPTGAPR